MLGSDSSASVASPRVVPVAPERARRGLLRRARNRRVAVQGPTPLVAIADGVAGFGRRLWVVVRAVGKVLLALGCAALIGWGGRLGVGHVLASPRFAVRDVQVSPTAHVPMDDILTMADVRAGDRLLAIDPDAVAARIARHPWVASVRVRRQLPSVLRIDVRERTAAAVAALGGLYLVDDTGRPFKRATMDEADGLPVLTGLDRGHYAQLRDASEAAFREALGIAAVYRARAGRPPVSEVNVDPRFGFTLFLQGGTEVRLGRGDYGKKLARLDQILEAVKAAGATGAIKAVGLDGASGGRIPVRLEKRDL